jgi:hypothetical protein
LLRKPLTVIDQFHSHLEPMKFLRQDTFHDQVSSVGSKKILHIQGETVATESLVFYPEAGGSVLLRGLAFSCKLLATAGYTSSPVMSLLKWS